jgi:hypothetical protein
MARYRDYLDRADLVICGDCSTRTLLCVVEREEIPEHDKMHTYQVFRDAWDAAQLAHREEDTHVTYEEEDKAYQRLIDFVEANDLNYTEWDPRGPQGDA